LFSLSFSDAAGPRAAAAALAAVALSGLLTSCGTGSGGSEQSFTVGLVEPDIAAVPLLAAVEAVRAEGYDVTIQETAEPELAIEGLIRGDYQFSAEATGPALIAISRGAPVRIVADMVANQWAVYGDAGIADCSGLDGRPFGIYSEGAVATAMVRQWVATSCPDGVSPEYLTIGDSQVRAQALLAGEISATALEESDVATLAGSEQGDSLHRLADFRRTFPGLHPQTVYANADYLRDHPEPAQALVDALVAESRKINEDPGYLVELVHEHLPGEYSDAVLRETATRYAEAGLFDPAGLTPESVQSTIDFFVRAGGVDPMDADDAADLSFVNRTSTTGGHDS
jgi:ABC-type nitrate/sulfonate/bicarbonate transport system substrate-binding protein